MHVALEKIAHWNIPLFTYLLFTNYLGTPQEKATFLKTALQKRFEWTDEDELTNFCFRIERQFIQNKSIGNHKPLLHYLLDQESASKSELIYKLILLFLEDSATNSHGQNSQDGCTTLQRICSSGFDHTMVSLLLDKGADADAQDKWGNTVLMDVISTLGQNDNNELTKKVEIISKLLSRVVKIDRADKGGTTALMRASHCEYTSIIEKLLEKGANCNLQSKNSKTALAYALSTQDSDSLKVEKVSILLKGGADILIPDNAGQTPLEIACRQGKSPLIKILLEHYICQRSLTPTDSHNILAHLGKEVKDPTVLSQIEQSLLNH